MLMSDPVIAAATEIVQQAGAVTDER